MITISGDHLNYSKNCFSGENDSPDGKGPSTGCEDSLVLVGEFSIVWDSKDLDGEESEENIYNVTDKIDVVEVI